ncbi:MAG: IPT/TIG domain-containing protein, partial [Chloroflexota bacterium]
MKRIQAPTIVALLLFTLILSQPVLAQPVISNVDEVDITATSAAIIWLTSENATSEVQYGTTTLLGNTESDGSTVVVHYIPLTGLDPDTLYYYAVYSDGVRSPAVITEYHSFTTTKLPEEYSISLDHACGVCGELVEAGICGEIIEVTAIVAAAGTYHICWDARTEASTVATFTAGGAGIYTAVFYMPEDTKGSHNVYLVNNTYADPGTNTFATFEVLPSVKTDLSEGPVGTEVTLNGYGFSNGQDVRVSLYQGGARKGEYETADANSQGSWTVPYTIPDTPAGGYILKIEGQEGTIWVGWVNKDFEVTPQISTNTEAGTVGQTIEVNGTGFASEEEDIEITFDGEVVQTNNPIVADDSGSWEAMLRIPPLQRGTYRVDASGESTRARDVPDIEFIVGAGVWVEPGMAYVGDAITVTGGGFAPEETGVRVTFDGTVVATSISVDTNGSWESSFDLQASTYGSHTVSASGDTTSSVTTTLNTQAEITVLSPAEGSPGDSITLEGDGFHGSQALTVTIGGIAASGNLQTQSNGNFNISFRVPRGSPEGEQTLVVTDEGGATDSIDFTVMEKILSTTPLPISPQDNTLRSGEVTFQWGTGGDTGYTYNLEISQTAAFTTNFRSKSGIVETTYTLTDTATVTETLPPGTYYWRVKIVDDYGNEGEWSDSIEFRVSPIPTWVWVVIGLVVLVVLM